MLISTAAVIVIIRFSTFVTELVLKKSKVMSKVSPAAIWSAPISYEPMIMLGAAFVLPPSEDTLSEEAISVTAPLACPETALFFAP